MTPYLHDDNDDDDIDDDHDSDGWPHPRRIPTAFTINGYAHSQEAVARLLARLRLLPMLGDVTLGSTTQGDDDRVELSTPRSGFSLKASAEHPG